MAEAIQSGRFISSIYTKTSVFESLSQKYLKEGLINRQNLDDTFILPNTKDLTKLNLSEALIIAIQHNLEG